MPKILLIEDDPDQVLLYTTQFKLDGLNLLTTLTGREGLIKSETERPDLILLDIVLTDIDGMVVLEKLKENPSTRKIPVILLSNLIKKDLINRGKQLGALDFWAKTEVMPKEIVRRVKKILKRKSK